MEDEFSLLICEHSTLVLSSKMCGSVCVWTMKPV